jgi:hypothetical protein
MTARKSLDGSEKSCEEDGDCRQLANPLGYFIWHLDSSGAHLQQQIVSFLSGTVLKRAMIQDVDMAILTEGEFRLMKGSSGPTRLYYQDSVRNSACDTVSLNEAAFVYRCFTGYLADQRAILHYFQKQ